MPTKWSASSVIGSIVVSVQSIVGSVDWLITTNNGWVQSVRVAAVHGCNESEKETS